MTDSVALEDEMRCIAYDVWGDRGDGMGGWGVSHSVGSCAGLCVCGCF